ncbi:hypothetical protein [Thermolongibacillus altinsuensis]|uniref:hypothetical protein n=1 Tax=Thermolongibacillus altinsuensis TaxID=575256 RepID=UPI00242A2D5D|nr:hypothetical protein [Thermolongibacillus altinsuensis]GMB08101.1 hypothetical protein B1no1_08110 [Thermolongibacillus altinsuensis]
MNVKTLIHVLEKALVILKHYEHCTVDEMLNDISVKILSDQNKPIKNKKTPNDADYSNAIKKMKDMNKAEASQFLSSFKKEELLRMGTQMNIKLQKKDTKKILIESIITHCSFAELYAQMANRKHQKQMSEQT